MKVKKPRQPVDEASNFKAWELVGQILETAIKYGCLLGAFGFLYLSIDTLAGRDTNAKIDLTTNIQLCESADWPYWLAALCFAAAVSGVAYGYAQLQAKRETIAVLNTYTKKLEEQIDKNRSSSGINQNGTTNPGDE